MKSLTTFTNSEIIDIWNAAKDRIEADLRCGRVKKSNTNPMDKCFMILCVLKHGGSWKYDSAIFKLLSSSFEMMILKMLSALKKYYIQFFWNLCAIPWRWGTWRRKMNSSPIFQKICTPRTWRSIIKTDLWVVWEKHGHIIVESTFFKYSRQKSLFCQTESLLKFIFMLREA